MKKILFSAMAIGGLIMASCSQDVYEAPVQEAFSKSFTEVFGEIDPAQTWNMYETKSLTIVGDGSDVTIFAKEGNTWKYADKYTELSGSRKVEFPALTSCNEFIVSNGSRTIRVENGGTASFASTRAILSEGVENVYTEVGYREFSVAEVNAFSKMVPESADNAKNDGLVSDFAAIQKQGTTFSLYPVYWNTANYHTFGIYYYENGKRKEVDIFTTRQGDDMCQYKTSDGNWHNYKNKKFSWSENGTTRFSGFESYDSSATSLRAKGVRITIADNIKFGFYVKVDGSAFNDGVYTVYSESALNEDKESRASFFRAHVDEEMGTAYNTTTFLGFEDAGWSNEDNNDLNDLVVVFDPEPEILNMETEGHVRLVCEDLGSTADYDYNDVVFDVDYNRLNGDTYRIAVTPRAAGGTIPAHIYYNDTDLGEIHAMLGGKANQMINTTEAGKAGEKIEIENIDKEFNISELSMVVNGKIKGFSVRVAGKQDIVMPGQGEAPMMMAVPQSWAWPKETIRIDEAYPKFGKFGQNHASSTWYIECVKNLTLKNL